MTENANRIQISVSSNVPNVCDFNVNIEFCKLRTINTFLNFLSLFNLLTQFFKHYSQLREKHRFVFCSERLFILLFLNYIDTLYIKKVLNVLMEGNVHTCGKRMEICSSTYSSSGSTIKTSQLKSHTEILKISEKRRLNSSRNNNDATLEEKEKEKASLPQILVMIICFLYC